MVDAVINFYRLFHNLSLTALLAFMAMSVHAADPNDSDKWEFGADVYLWGATIDARPTGEDNIHISFSDIMGDLDMALMGGLSARKGKWSLFSDIIYLDLDDDQKGKVDLLGMSIKDDFDVKIKAWIVTTAGGYTLLERDRFSLDLLAGARYLWLDIPLEAKIGPKKVKASPSGNGWDGILGVKGQLDFSDNW
jgi:hypothetical protein